MTILSEEFPPLARELSHALRSGEQVSLADQLESATVERVTFDPEANAGYIYLHPARELNIVEKNMVFGARVRESQEVETQYWTVIDIDNFGRVIGVEVLSPGDMKPELIEHART
jgi:uncharacterized protein YuzE